MLGDIVLLNRKKGGWFSAAQRLFTGKPYTHCAVGCGNVMGQDSVLSANELIVVEPLQRYFEEDGTDIEIYRVDVEPKVAMDIVSKQYMEYAGGVYGFAQTVWFIWRALNENLFKRDIRKSNNWFPKGEICSEMVYEYLTEIADKFPDLDKKLQEWNADTINAGDIADICKQFPSIFQLTTKK